jgi:hypothetical protein
VFERIEGEHSVQQDLVATNPNFVTGKPEYTLNCGDCVVAYEMRRRGFDVEALPRKWMHVNEWKELFDSFTPKALLSVTNTEALAEIEQIMLQWGEGARGTVFGEWKNRNDGHFFSAEVSDGKVMFVDSQNGESDVRRYFNRMKPTSLIFGRLDNLKPTEAVKNVVKNKGA